MKIAYVMETLAICGGLERIMVDKMNYLADHDICDVVLIEVYDYPGNDAFALSEKVKRIRLGIKKHKQIFIKPFTFWRVANKVNNVIKREKPDVMTSAALLGEILYGLRRYPCRMIYESHQARHTMPLPWLMRRMEQNVDTVICLTEGDAKEYKHARHVTVIPNFIRKEKGERRKRKGERREEKGERREEKGERREEKGERREEKGERRKEKREKRNIVALGRLEKHKGFDMLINAWLLIHDKADSYTLHIFGDGRERETLQQLISSLHLNNSVTLHNATDNTADVYNTADIVCVTSEYEGFSLVTVEALAHGIPVVACNVPYGPAELLQDGRGGILVERTPQHIAAAILSIITDRSLHNRLSNDGPVIAAKYNQDRIMKQWTEIINS